MDFNKYLGTWYELMHYPSWFQRNDNYNTKAEYELLSNGMIGVKNSTIVVGKEVSSYGTAKILGPYNLRVNFSPNEVSSLLTSGNFKVPNTSEVINSVNYLNPNTPNYVIDKLWYDRNGNYVYSVVTDPKRNSLFVLSRYSNPPLSEYNEIMKYVVANYDRDRLVQTPHY